MVKEHQKLLLMLGLMVGTDLMPLWISMLGQLWISAPQKTKLQGSELRGILCQLD